MAITPAQLLARVRVSLEDTEVPYTYTDADINSMVIQAMEAYTAVFPLPYLTQMDDWAGSVAESPDGINYHANVLPTNYRAMRAIYKGETLRRLYETDGTPITPEENHYTYLDYRHPNFFHGRHYDVVHGALIAQSNTQTLLISVGLKEDEFMMIEYLGTYVVDIVIPIADQHIPIITTYCQAAFARRRALVRSTELSTGNVYQIGQAARDVTAHYNQLMRDARANPPSYLTLSSNTPIPRQVKSAAKRWS